MNQQSHSVVMWLSEFIHAVQAERGSACLLASEPSDVHRAKYQQLCRKSDAIAAQFANLSDPSSKKIHAVWMLFLGNCEFRKTTTEATPNDLLMVYSRQVVNHLVNVYVSLILTEKPEESTAISALSNFINWKERIGRERALGVMGLALDRFESPTFKMDFQWLLDEQAVNQRAFLAVATEQQKKLFEDNHKEVQLLSTYQQKLTAEHTVAISPDDWFELVTEKVNMMFELELLMLQALFETEVKPKIDHGHHLPASDRLIIDDFLIFRQLTDDVKSALLQSSHHKTYKKGSLLFLEGEQASRIYVVLSGWVKIFKSTNDGEEQIERMLTSGDVVIESSIFEQSNYHNAAQVSVESRLLSFPAAIFRHWVNQDLTLALNTLKYLSHSNMTYHMQIESNRIKSTKERVGHFLLKQFIAQRNPNTIMLPYEKAIISAVLDMKPETFSRSLKSFKKEGLVSEKQQIQVQNIDMLCQYCDREIAAQCEFKKTKPCLFNEQADQLPTSINRP